MGAFEYRALDGEGKELRGTVDARDPAEARAKLRSQGMHPSVIRSLDRERFGEERRWSPWHGVRHQDVVVLTRQLATLLRGGLPLVHALRAVIEQLGSHPLGGVVADVEEKVREGKSFSQALGNHPRVFAPLFVNMVRAGERGGSLEGILARLADYGDKRVALRNRVRAALAYPLLLVIFGIIILSVLLAFVVPMITRVFLDTGRELPLITHLLIGISRFLLDNGWFILIVVLGVLVAARLALRKERVRFFLDRFSLRAPLLGPIVQGVAVSRFARTLGTLIGSGVPILECFSIVRDVVGNMVFAQALEQAQAQIGRGENITRPLQASGIFPPIVTRMIAAGEQSDDLEGILLRVAESYENETEARISSLISLLEPLAIVVMAVVVSFVLLAIILPLAEMSELIH